MTDTRIIQRFQEKEGEWVFVPQIKDKVLYSYYGVFEEAYRDFGCEPFKTLVEAAKYLSRYEQKP